MSLASRPWQGIVLALSIAFCLAPLGATAQPSLPWTDANPLEKLFGKPGESRRSTTERKGSAAAPSAPALSAVPIPDARPDAGAEVSSPSVESNAPAEEMPAEEADKVPNAAVAGSKPAVPDSENAASGGPSSPPVTPDGSPTPPTDAEPAVAIKPEPADAEAAPVPVADDASPEAPANTDEAADTSVSAPINPLPADPATTATKPISEIPVPELRPATATEADPLPPTPVVPPPAAETEAEAPNSTDKLKARTEEITPAAAVDAAAAVEDAELCEAELRQRGVAFTVDRSISEGDCGVLRPVNVTRLSSGVAVSPKTQMLCRTALALDTWMSDSVVPAAKAQVPDDKLTEFRHASTYVCRPRASEGGISEHARGSAIDISAFVFEGRAEIGVDIQAPGTSEAAFQAAVRKGACGPFKTVLGPGTDADHANHFHLDVAARRNGATYCK